jgi:cytochrome P450
MASWSAHRNPKYFPEPDAFKPSRWLSSDKADTSSTSDGHGGTAEMKKLYMPFGKGRHRCAGEAMAMLSLRLITATLLLKFKVTLASDAKPEDMDWDDHFLIILKRGCYLDFTPIS